MSIYNNIIGSILKQKVAGIEHFKANPLKVQQEVFQHLLKKGKNTFFGLNFDFESIRSMDEFKERVPLQQYDTLKLYIEKALRGDADVLWPGKVTWFAKSSGTTADKSKYIPVTPDALKYCHFLGGQQLLALYYQQNSNANIFSGKSLSIGGSTAVNQENANSFSADLSAIIIKNVPFWADYVRTPGKDTLLMHDWEQKINIIAEQTIKEDVRSLSGVPSWNMILLKKILEKTGKENILQVWPNLELYAHGGVNFDSYRNQYQQLIPSDKMTYLETYNASEGFFGIQDIFDGSQQNGEMLLMLNQGVFYEFLPVENLHDKNPKTLQLNEVETDKNYALIISTNAGLWRYMIGDTIKFTSLNPFRIKVSGRTKYFINIFGEELIEDNANKALKTACEKTGVLAAEYTVAPILPNENGQGAHEWIVEFEGNLPDKSLFANELDKALQASNSDYEAKRQHNMALRLPEIHFVDKGFFYEAMRRKGKIGGQNKVPRMLNDRSFIDFVLN